MHRGRYMGTAKYFVGKKSMIRNFNHFDLNTNELKMHRGRYMGTTKYVE